MALKMQQKWLLLHLDYIELFLFAYIYVSDGNNVAVVFSMSSTYIVTCYLFVCFQSWVDVLVLVSLHYCTERSLGGHFSICEIPSTSGGLIVSPAFCCSMSSDKQKHFSFPRAVL